MSTVSKHCAMHCVNSLPSTISKAPTNTSARSRCFDYPVLLDAYRSARCKKPVTADKNFTIHDAPLVLTIHLKRFSPMGRKIGHCVKYDERLSLQPVMSEGQHGPTYSLYGVISHAGGGPSSGHYYAHVKSSDGQWYEMNDETVTRSGVPTSRQNAYVLFYIRDKGQALEAAVSTPTRTTPLVQPAQPARTGLVAGMKKRKAPDSEGEESTRSAKTKDRAPFIGPQLPSSSQVQDKPDPQAKMLQKKIGQVTKQAPPKNGLAELAQYSDDSDDVGEKVEDEKDEEDKEAKEDKEDKEETEVKAEDPVTPAKQESSALLPSPEISTPTSKTTASSSVLASIPSSSFYGGGSNKKKGKGDSAKKRKSSDSDDDEQSIKDWARTPISVSSRKASTPPSKRYGGVGGNPYNRVKGSDTLTPRRESLPSVLRAPLRYGKKRRLIM